MSPTIQSLSTRCLRHAVRGASALTGNGRVFDWLCGASFLLMATVLFVDNLPVPELPSLAELSIQDQLAVR